MKKITLTIYLFLFIIPLYSQSKEHILNFDFEINKNRIPIGWTYSGSSDYSISLDSTIFKKGKNSIKIEFNGGKEDYKSLEFSLPHNYDGKKITLSGYLKTENISTGYAGLWMLINPNIIGDNMRDRGVVGTTDWNKYEITLDLKPSETEQIIIGGLLRGNGKMWIDDLTVTIDGKKIEDLLPLERKILPAEKDYEFNEGSQINSLSLDNKKIENLKNLGLIWGFLKYYHPNIAKGNFNWDFELFRIMPKIINAENSENINTIYLSLINRLGAFEISKESFKKNDDIKIEPDLDWIENSNFSKQLTDLLINIKNANRINEHYYIRLSDNIGVPTFKNEDSYESMLFPDLGYRILSLYRYWNIIHYYFPYRNLIDDDWKKVLEDFIPKIVKDENELEYTLTILELITKISDTHADIWSNKVLKNYEGSNYAAIEAAFIEDKLTVIHFNDENLGKQTGLEIGDVILKINNITVNKIVENKLKYTSASNYPTKLRNIAWSILKSKDSIINVEFSRKHKIYKKTLKTYSTKEINPFSRYQVKEKDTCFKFVSENIAYINHQALKRKYIPVIWSQIKKSKTLIIDMRNYPEDFPLDVLSKYLLPKKTAYAKFSDGSIITPGQFKYTSLQSTGGLNNDYYKGKVVILVNEITQSASEYHAMAYSQSPNAIVIGSTTAAADGNISTFFLPGNIMTAISGIGVYYPNGMETQRIGIIPNIIVKPTIKGIIENKDEILEKAIELANK